MTLPCPLESIQERFWLPSGVVEHLVSRKEIAELLGVSQQRVYQLLRHADFPEPAADLAIGKVWKRSDILAWARRTGRLDDPDEHA